MIFVFNFTLLLGDASSNTTRQRVYPLYKGFYRSNKYDELSLVVLY